MLETLNFSLCSLCPAYQTALNFLIQKNLSNRPRVLQSTKMYFRDIAVLSDAGFSSEAPCISFTILQFNFFFYQNNCLEETFFTSKYLATAIHDKVPFDSYKSKILFTFTFKNTNDSNTQDSVTRAPNKFQPKKRGKEDHLQFKRGLWQTQE